MEKIKAFIVLNEGYEPNDETKNNIMEYLRTKIARYSLPYEIEFRDALPKTLIGKVNVRQLEEEENAKNNF